MDAQFTLLIGRARLSRTGLLGKKRAPHYFDRHFEEHGTFADTFLKSTVKKFVYPLNSYRLNERSAIQQGFFVCQGDIRHSFEATFWLSWPKPKSNDAQIRDPPESA